MRTGYGASQLFVEICKLVGLEMQLWGYVLREKHREGCVRKGCETKIVQNLIIPV